MSEMSAAGKFFASGLDEMRKVVRKTDGAVRGLMMSYNNQLRSKDENITFLRSLVAGLRQKLDESSRSAPMLAPVIPPTGRLLNVFMVKLMKCSVDSN